jgi:translocation and assembly module TamB
VLALLAAAFAVGALWLFASEAGLRWAVAELEAASAGGLRIERPRGTLASGVFADRVALRSAGLDVVAEGFGARLRPFALLSARLEVEPLSIERLSLALSAAPGGQPARPPSLPLGVKIGEATIGRLEIVRGEARLALRDIRIARFELGALHTLGAAAQFSLDDARFPVSARLELGGSLERVRAALSAELAGARAELKARLAPFQRQPVEALELRASGVDLARLDRALPRTAFSASLRAEGARQGLAGTLSAANAAPGPLDAARLPLASLEARFATQGLASASFERARLVLADGGALEGGGELAPGRGAATLVAKGLNLRALYSTLRRTALDGALHLVLTPGEQALRASLSEEGVTLSAEVVRRGDTIEIGALRAAAGRGEASGSGTVKLGAPPSFAGKLALARFDPAALGDYPRGALNGSVELSGELGDAPRVDLAWSLDDSTLFDLALQTHGRARIARQRVSDANAQVRLEEARLEARGSFGAPGDALEVSLAVPELSELAADIGGRVQARATLRGTWREPQAELAAQGEALQLPSGLVVERASVRFAGTPARHGLSLSARLYDADVVAELRGGVEHGLDGLLGGSPSWRGQLVSLASSGAVELHSLAPAPLAVSRERVELGRLEATLARGRILVRELVRTRSRVSSSGEFTSLPAGWLFSAAGVGERVRSTLLLDGQWTIAAAPSLEGTLRVRRAQGDVTVLGDRALDLGLEAVSLDARFTSAGVAAKMDVASQLLNGALGGQILRAPQAGGLGLTRDSPIVLQGNFDLASLGVLVGPYLASEGRVDGRVSADVTVSGTLGAPALAATLRGEALSVDLPPYGVYLRDGVLLARVENDVLQVKQFEIRGGQGKFSAQGALPLRLADGNAKLAWQASEFTVLDRQNMRLVASGKGEASFDGRKLFLTGELRADRGSLEYAADRLPTLDEDIVIEGEPRRASAAKTPLPIALNIALDLGDDLNVQMRGFEGKLAGRINLKTTPEGELRAYGELRAVRATYLAYGQRLRVDPGVLLFDGPVDNPALQITAWRRNQAVEAGIQLSGTVRSPRVQLVSQPPVPDNEKLSWLVLGRAPSDITRADIGLLQAAAGALLTRGDTTSMPLDRRLARTFGLDEITLRGTGDAEDRVVAFGKRLSDRLYVSYEAGIGTIASNLVKLDYSLSRRWSARVETGTSSGGGLFYRFSWD